MNTSKRKMPSTALIIIVVVLLVVLIFEILAYAKVKGFTKPGMTGTGASTSRQTACKGCKKTSSSRFT